MRNLTDFYIQAKDSCDLGTLAEYYTYFAYDGWNARSFLKGGVFLCHLARIILIPDAGARLHVYIRSLSPFKSLTHLAHLSGILCIENFFVDIYKGGGRGVQYVRAVADTVPTLAYAVTCVLNETQLQKEVVRWYDL